MNYKKGIKDNHPPPSGALRGSQIISTFGPGSLVDLVDQAVMIGGLEFWADGPSSHGLSVTEPRLRQSLFHKMEEWGRPLDWGKPFVAPPVGDDRNPSREKGIHVLEFPRWLVCQKQSCRSLVAIGSKLLLTKNGRYYHACDAGEPNMAVPARFVAACHDGHIEEFPWHFFAHQSSLENDCKSKNLSLHQGPGGDIGDIAVVCNACGARRSMIEAQGKNIGLSCNGERPWLGKDAKETCGEKLSLLVRTASNGYFAQVVSALSIPTKEDPVALCVEDLWPSVFKFTNKAQLETARIMSPLDVKLAPFSDDEILEAIAQRREKKNTTPMPIKHAEWDHLTSVPADPAATQIPARDDVFFARKAPSTLILPDRVELTLVRRLREVRVQVGFTRLQTSGTDMLGEIDRSRKPAALSISAGCLPAVELLGEGLFFRVDEAALRAWESRPEVRAREQKLASGHAAWLADVERPSLSHAFRGARFYMLHTLSHLLMSAISLECGYAASALRERLYCSMPNDNRKPAMAGFLLSTGSPGSEGTLGGLVDQYRHIQRHFHRASRLGALCSNDPVCALHEPDHANGERHLEGAACHGCLHVAECSCECFNEYLDRALVFPTLGHDKELAFFAEPL